jgi:hypothetical protein
MSSEIAKPTLYDRLGGVYSIAAVVDDFIDRVMHNPVLNANAAVDEKVVIGGEDCVGHSIMRARAQRRCFREASICVPQADYIGRVAQLARGSTVSRRRLPEMGQRAAEAPAGFVLLSLLC